MALQEFFQLVQLAFVVGFSTFLFKCVDYGILFRYHFKIQCIVFVFVYIHCRNFYRDKPPPHNGTKVSVSSLPKFLIQHDTI